MSTYLHCVVRELRPGDSQYVPVNEVLRDMHALIFGEDVFVGQFDTQIKGFVGPSQSYVRTICLPRGRLVTVHAGDRVWREVSPGEFEYVPVTEVVLIGGEKVYPGHIFN